MTLQDPDSGLSRAILGLTVASRKTSRLFVVEHADLAVTRNCGTRESSIFIRGYCLNEGFEHSTHMRDECGNI